MYSANVCLSPRNASAQLKFTPNDVYGGIADVKKKNKYAVLVQCFPLVSLMAAVGKREIDYFFLDVEGAEIDILKTIPFDEMYIKVMTIEYRMYDVRGRVDKVRSLQKLVELRALLRDWYNLVKILYFEHSSARVKSPATGLDAVFVRK